MKTRKKMVLGITGVILMFAIVFIACKKNSDETLESTKDPVTQSNNVLARSSGSQTSYSKGSSSGLYYKMVLSWNTSGQVSVDRSIISSGYPAGTGTQFIIGDNTAYSKVDLDTTVIGVDTVIVHYQANKDYFVISFEPNTDGGYANGPIVTDARVYCQCQSNGGGNCRLENGTGGPNSFICQTSTCSKCQVVGTGCPKFYAGMEGALPLFQSGCVLVEASSINVIN